MRGLMRSIPGVEFVHGFLNETGDPVAVVGYADRAAYDRIVNDPNGPFETAVAAHRMDEVGEWAWSERGETIE